MKWSQSCYPSHMSLILWPSGCWSLHSISLHSWGRAARWCRGRCSTGSAANGCRWAHSEHRGRPSCHSKTQTRHADNSVFCCLMCNKGSTPTRCESSWGLQRWDRRWSPWERPEALWLSCRSKPLTPQTGHCSRSTPCRRCALTLAPQSRPQTSPGSRKNKVGLDATMKFVVLSTKCSMYLVEDSEFSLMRLAIAKNLLKYLEAVVDTSRVSDVNQRFGITNFHQRSRVNVVFFLQSGRGSPQRLRFLPIVIFLGVTGVSQVNFYFVWIVCFHHCVHPNMWRNQRAERAEWRPDTRRAASTQASLHRLRLYWERDGALDGICRWSFKSRSYFCVCVLGGGSVRKE